MKNHFNFVHYDSDDFFMVLSYTFSLPEGDTMRMPHYFYVSATFSSFFLLQNSLHCLLVASRFMFYTQESRHHIMIDFSLNPRREWCENSEIINKPFDSFNVRCWTELKGFSRLFLPFSIDFIKFVFYASSRESGNKASAETSWKSFDCNLHLKFGSQKTLLQRSLSLHLFVREEFLDFRFLSRTRFNVFFNKKFL